ncbi:dihydrodipicolinate synthase family protein [Pleomorphovibrio marinus]|uniref:dihydrodipicolinate synthase family protein n=1 Tax=Pleomorphovibrio marinus TaxID=2164132 RepID=UPI001E56F922|nr:dihydrodipicolinate synthase family protein [Pleomorphovibrio marinus]
MNEAKYIARREFLGKSVKGVLASLAGLTFSESLTAHQRITLPLREERRNIPVMLTAYQADGKIDYKGMDRLMDYYLEAGASGFFANCLSSEMYHLSPEERLKLTRYVVDHVKGTVPVVASGSFGKNIAEKADFINKMQDTGVDAVILITAHLAEEEEPDERLISYTRQILEKTPGVTLGTYECPNPYKRVVTPKVTQFLVESGRFIYHKDTTEDMQQIRQKLHYSDGSNWGLYNAHIGTAAKSLREGAKGLSPIAGNFYPEIISWMCAHAENPEKQKEVNWLQEKLIATEKKIGNQYQLGARYFLSKRGLDIAANCRSTDAKLTAEQQGVLDEVLKELPQWHERLGIS